jgi:hypothetical protein
MSSYIFGGLVKYIGRIGCFIVAALLNYSMIILMYFWEPNENQIVVLFIIGGLWGVASAIWQSQVICMIFVFLIIIVFQLIIFQPHTPFSIRAMIPVQ